jgi:hypothetical protein
VVLRGCDLLIGHDHNTALDRQQRLKLKVKVRLHVPRVMALLDYPGHLPQFGDNVVADSFLSRRTVTGGSVLWQGGLDVRRWWLVTARLGGGATTVGPCSMVRPASGADGGTHVEYEESCDA